MWCCFGQLPDVTRGTRASGILLWVSRPQCRLNGAKGIHTPQRGNGEIAATTIPPGQKRALWAKLVANDNHRTTLRGCAPHTATKEKGRSVDKAEKWLEGFYQYQAAHSRRPLTAMLPTIRRLGFYLQCLRCLLHMDRYKFKQPTSI